ncbi:MAG: MTH1187 family thiamine-binding protein [Myxococcales bacterium]
MIAEISVVPEGAKGSSMKAVVDAAVQAIGAAGVPYRVGELGTSVEGTYEQILEAFKAAREACVRQGAQRVLATLRLDDRRDHAEHLLEPQGKPKAPRPSPQEATGRAVDEIQQLPREAQLGVVRTVVPQLIRDMPLEQRAGYLRDLVAEIEGTLRGQAPYDVRPDAPSHQPS